MHTDIRAQRTHFNFITHLAGKFPIFPFTLLTKKNLEMSRHKRSGHNGQRTKEFSSGIEGLAEEKGLK